MLHLMFYNVYNVISHRFYQMKKKDLCMTALEKQGSLEIMEVEILAPIG